MLGRNITPGKRNSQGAGAVTLSRVTRAGLAEDDVCGQDSEGKRATQKGCDLYIHTM